MSVTKNQPKGMLGTVWLILAPWIAAALIVFYAQSDRAATVPYVTLAWDPSPSAEVVGYKVYWGTNSRAYVYCIDVGNTTTARVALISGWNYYAATAYDSWGLESDFSEELAWRPDTQFWDSWYNKYPMVLTVSSNGQTPFLTTTNLVNWQPAWEYSITNCWRSSDPKRFWTNAVITQTWY